MHTIWSLLHITTNVKSTFNIRVIDINKMQFSFETFKILRIAYFFVDLKNVNIKRKKDQKETCFFLSGFANIHESQESRGRGRVFL